jgi:integrase
MAHCKIALGNTTRVLARVKGRATPRGGQRRELVSTAALANPPSCKPLESAASQKTYRFAIDDFISWYCSEPRLAFGRTVVLRYRYYLEARRLSPATINLRLAAVRRLAYEAADNGLLSPDLAAGVRRVKGAKRLGMRLGNWLTPAQGKQLLGLPDVTSVKGKRNSLCWPCCWAADYVAETFAAASSESLVAIPLKLFTRTIRA